jgi:hypothetical protein
VPPNAARGTSPTPASESGRPTRSSSGTSWPNAGTGGSQGKDAATQTWNGVVSVLGSPVPPKLQAAIFKIAATLPGIETEELKDATGKSGIAVTRVDNRGPGGSIFAATEAVADPRGFGSGSITATLLRRMDIFP